MIGRPRPDKKDLLPNAWRLATSGAEWPFVAEHRFHAARRWRFDWACLDILLAIELQGVTHFGRAIGGHQGADGIERDMEKFNAAIELGWRVLLYSQRQVQRDPVGVVEQILRVAEGLRR